MVKQNIKAKIQKRNKFRFRFIKKIALTAFLGFGLMVTTASAEDTLKTVYHVYLDGEHIGKVDQQEIVEQHIEEKIATNAEKYTNLDLTIDEKVDYISEKVFDPTYNNEEVTSLLDENTAIVANAVDLK